MDTWWTVCVRDDQIFAALSDDAEPRARAAYERAVSTSQMPDRAYSGATVILRRNGWIVDKFMPNHEAS